MHCWEESREVVHSQVGSETEDVVVVVVAAAVVVVEVSEGLQV